MRYLRAIAVPLLLVLSAGDSVSQSIAVHSVQPRGPFEGRWHIQTTSGDQPAQAATGNPVSFDGLFVCNGGACGGLPVFMRDSTICDAIGFENMSAGLVVNGTDAGLQVSVSAGFTDNFIYTLIGTIISTYTTTRGVKSLASASVTGAYGSTPGGCNNGTVENQGTFVATWYPPIEDTLIGSIGQSGEGPAIGLELVLAQELRGTIRGRVYTGTERGNRNAEPAAFVPVQSSCFSSPSLEVMEGPGASTSEATGNRFQIYAIDTVGSALILKGVANERGSNRSYSVSYEISGGSCDGQSGDGAQFRAFDPAGLRHNVSP
jgi:hypothetical protein